MLSLASLPGINLVWSRCMTRMRYGSGWRASILVKIFRSAFSREIGSVTGAKREIIVFLGVNVMWVQDVSFGRVALVEGIEGSNEA